MDTHEHDTVLLTEAVTALVTDPDGVYIDGTFGRGGHSQAILNKLSERGRLVMMDRDPQAIAVANRLAANDPRLTVVHDSFTALGRVAAEQGLAGRVSGVLLDLGVSSPQLDDPERGFSFLRDGPLDMRMDPSRGVSAATWLARAEADDIARVLKDYGEERFAKRIARALVAARDEAPITRTGRLAEIIAAAHPAWEKGKHPATRSFQAIRIFINEELAALEQVLPQAVDVLAPAGRLVVISFHSLEDRLVKRYLRDEARGPQWPRHLPPPVDAPEPRLALVGKAQRPGEAEVADNPRARSAVMRVAERRS